MLYRTIVRLCQPPVAHFSVRRHRPVNGAKYACIALMDALTFCPIILAQTWRSRQHIAATNPSAMPEHGACSGYRNDHRIDIYQGNSILTDQNGALGRRDPVVTSAFPETALNFNGISIGPGVFPLARGLWAARADAAAGFQCTPQPGTESGLTPAIERQCTASTAPPPEP